MCEEFIGQFQIKAVVRRIIEPLGSGLKREATSQATTYQLKAEAQGPGHARMIIIRGHPVVRW